MDLLEENRDAARIYRITRGQIVSLGETAVDINHHAVWQAIDRIGVREPARCFELVSLVFHHMLARARDASTSSATGRVFGE